MAIGGRDIGTWDNTSPAAGDDSGLGDDHFRSVKTSIQTAIDAEHEFSTTGGANTGRHRPGSAVPYSDVQSNVSAGDIATRLYFASDTSRLFALGLSASSATIFIGSKNAVEHGTDTGELNHIWVEQSGHDTIDPGGTAAVNFIDKGGSEYSGLPDVQFSIVTDSVPAAGHPGAWMSVLTAGGFTALCRLGGGTTVSRGTLVWRSVGSRLI